MNLGVIVFYSIKYLLVLLVCILLTVALVRNKGVWFNPETIKDEGWRESAVRYKGWLKVFCIGVTVLGWYVWFSVAPPLVKDIPYITRGEYLQTEGIILYNELGGAAGRVQDRSFAIADPNTGEEIVFDTLETGLREGEYVRVTYLPNSHLATINYRSDGHEG